MEQTGPLIERVISLIEARRALGDSWTQALQISAAKVGRSDRWVWGRLKRHPQYRELRAKFSLRGRRRALPHPHQLPGRDGVTPKKEIPY